MGINIMTNARRQATGDIFFATNQVAMRRGVSPISMSGIPA